MDRNKLVAELWCPGESAGGSGLLIANGWVLTAHHVIAKPGQSADVNTEVDVRLLGDWKEGDANWYRYKLFWSSPKLDVALLRLDDEPSANAITTHPLQCGRLAGGQLFENCHCVGFPKITKKDNKNDTASVRGNIDTATLQCDDNVMEMQVTSQNAKDETQWQGLSGSVLFYQDVLVGVVTQVSTLYSDNVIRLCPIDVLFHHPDFSKFALNGLLLPPLITCSPTTVTLDQSQKLDLPKLVCYLNRGSQITSVKNMLHTINKDSTLQRSFVCAVVGEQIHLHGAFIDRLEQDVLPGIFGHCTAYSQIRNIDFPNNVDNVALELEKLKQRLYNELNIIDAPERIIETFNSGETPRIFRCFVYGDSFTKDHGELLKQWAEFWHALGSESLMCVVGMIICLCTDESQKDNASASWWKFWERKSQPSLRDFKLDNGSNTYEHLELDYCRDHHLDDWIDFLESSPHYNWSVQFLKPVAYDFSEKNKFAMKEVRSAIFHSLEET